MLSNHQIVMNIIDNYSLQFKITVDFSFSQSCVCFLYFLCMRILLTIILCKNRQYGLTFTFLVFSFLFFFLYSS